MPNGETVRISLPNIAHSTSDQTMFVSIKTLVSYLYASCKACVYSDAVRTLETPTDDPDWAGLTKNGSHRVETTTSKSIVDCCVQQRYGTIGRFA